MGQIVVRCPACSTEGSTPTAWAGKTVQCKKCRTRFPASGSGTPPPAGPGRRAAADGIQQLWEVGDLVLGRYEVVPLADGVPHAEGGFGRVNRVRDRESGADLAVKSVHPRVLSRDGAAEDFVREAEVWVTRVGRHPHIVAAEYVLVLGGLPRVFAEFVGGGTLHHWAASGRLYDGGPDAALRRVLDVLIQFAWGLHYCHEQGLVHRDVKPANVMMTPDGVAKVTDFGLAGARTAVAAEPADGGPPGRTVVVPGVGACTRAYASPEQLGGRTLTRRTDVYSWAVSALQLFARAVPQVGPAALALLERHVRTGGAGAGLPVMPQAVADLLRRCLHPDPDGRPRDMAAVARGLTEVCTAVAGRPYPRAEPKPVEDLADTLNNRAVSLVNLGQEAAALRCWRGAIATDAAHLEAVVNLGRWEWARGQIDDVEYFKRLSHLGTVHGGRQDYTAALAAARHERGDPTADFVHRFDLPDVVRAMACDPGGAYALAVGTGRVIRMLDPANRVGPIDAWQSPGTIYEQYAIAVSPDGGLL